MRFKCAAHKSVGSADFFRAAAQSPQSSVSGSVSSRRAADFSSSTFSLGNFSGLVTGSFSHIGTLTVKLAPHMHSLLPMMSRNTVAHVAVTWALRALLWLVVGAFFLGRPHAPLTAMVTLFGAFAFADGVICLTAAAVRRGPRELYAVGACGLAIGVVMLLQPSFAAPGLSGWVGLWAAARGTFEVLLGLRVRRAVPRDHALMYSGIVSIALALMMIVVPRVGFLRLSFWMGAYAVALGVMMAVVTAHLRRGALPSLNTRLPT
jgi:uncharacterized membrane protein HdeD (DUF308 family)